MIKKYDDNNIIVWDFGADVGIRYVIENKRNVNIKIYLNGMDDYITIDKKGKTCLFYGDYSDDVVRCIMDGNTVYYFLKNDENGSSENN